MLGVEILYSTFSTEEAAPWAVTYYISSTAAVRGRVSGGNHLLGYVAYVQRGLV